MTQDRERKIRELLPKERRYLQENEHLTGIKEVTKEKILHGIYEANRMRDDCLAAIKDKVVLKEELLSVENIANIIANHYIQAPVSFKMIRIKEFFQKGEIAGLAQALHDEQERRGGINNG